MSFDAARGQHALLSPETVWARLIHIRADLLSGLSLVIMAVVLAL